MCVCEGAGRPIWTHKKSVEKGRRLRNSIHAQMTFLFLVFSLTLTSRCRSTCAENPGSERQPSRCMALALPMGSTVGLISTVIKGIVVGVRQCVCVSGWVLARVNQKKSALQR